MRSLTELTVVAVLLLLVVAPEPAYAYVDPGTASYAFQVVAGALLGGIFLLKTYWGKFRDSVRNHVSRVRRFRT
jgi:hypothetical protein